jgi:hypothetical protein
MVTIYRIPHGIRDYLIEFPIPFRILNECRVPAEEYKEDELRIRMRCSAYFTTEVLLSVIRHIRKESFFPGLFLRDKSVMCNRLFRNTCGRKVTVLAEG